MQNFIVLGIIPGTNIQLNFDFWLYVAAGLIGLRVLRFIWRHRFAPRNYLAGVLIARVIDQHQ